MKATLIRRMLAVPVVALLGMTTVLAAAPAQAQNDWVEPPNPYMSTILTGGDYVWGAAVWQPAPALLAVGWDGEQEVPIPDTWGGEMYPYLQPMTIEFDWGDGSTPTTFSSDDPATDEAWVFCDNAVEYGEGGILQPGENFGYNCRVEAAHTYTTQGVMDIALEVSQGGVTASAVTKQLVVDPKVGGSLTVKGTVEARSAGMYDTDFPQVGDDTTTNVSVTAKRRAGTTATTANVVISVPGMHPEYYETTGMTFRGAYALQPLYVTKTKTGGEAVLLRVEGRVTTTSGIDAGGAQAMIQVRVAKGSPTLIRVQVWNTSAGFSYLDTGYQPGSYLGLDTTHDLLLSGSVRIG